MMFEAETLQRIYDHDQQRQQLVPTTEATPALGEEQEQQGQAQSGQHGRQEWQQQQYIGFHLQQQEQQQQQQQQQGDGSAVCYHHQQQQQQQQVPACLQVPPGSFQEAFQLAQDSHAISQQLEGIWQQLLGEKVNLCRYPVSKAAPVIPPIGLVATAAAGANAAAAGSGATSSVTSAAQAVYPSTSYGSYLTGMDTGPHAAAAAAAPGAAAFGIGGGSVAGVLPFGAAVVHHAPHPFSAPPLTWLHGPVTGMLPLVHMPTSTLVAAVLAGVGPGYQQEAAAVRPAQPPPPAAGSRAAAVGTAGWTDVRPGYQQEAAAVGPAQPPPPAAGSRAAAVGTAGWTDVRPGYQQEAAAVGPAQPPPPPPAAGSRGAAAGAVGTAGWTGVAPGYQPASSPAIASTPPAGGTAVAAGAGGGTGVAAATVAAAGGASSYAAAVRDLHNTSVVWELLATAGGRAGAAVQEAGNAAPQGACPTTDCKDASYTTTRSSSIGTPLSLSGTSTAGLAEPETAAAAAAAMSNGAAILSSYRQRRYSDVGPLGTAQITQQLISQTLGSLGSAAAAAAKAVGVDDGGGDHGLCAFATLPGGIGVSSHNSSGSQGLMAKSLSCILPVVQAGFQQGGVMLKGCGKADAELLGGTRAAVGQQQQQQECRQ